MTTAQGKTIGMVINSQLPFPHAPIVELLAKQIKEYIDAKNSLMSTIQIIDLADFELPQLPNASDLLSTTLFSPSTDQQIAAWQKEAEKHSGFIFIFPFHIWSYCNPVKNAISILHPNTWIRKPAMYATYGSMESRWDRITRKKSEPMMREFFVENGFRITKTGLMPEFELYADYWEGWKMGRMTGWVGFGGQQDEAFEWRGWNIVDVAITSLREDLDKNRKKQ